MSAPGALADRLAGWIGERLGVAGVRVEGLVRHTEGFSWETWTLDAAWREPGSGASWREGFAVRIEPADGMLAPYDTAAQYRLLEQLARSGVPVPRVRWLELDHAVLGAPFYAMERVDGRVPVQWDADRMFPTEQARTRFGRRFVDVQAQIHGLDWRALGLDWLALAGDPVSSAAAQLAYWVEFYERSRILEVPALRQAIAWLQHNLRPSPALVLCHGDYRIGNVMERDGELAAVFDWELAHIGDPIEDLAYAGLPLWRGRDPRISHFLMPAEFFERYEQRTGFAVDPQAYRAWTVFGLLKAGACHLRGARAFEDGRTGDLRLAAMGHQIQHVVRHLLPLLAADGD